MVKVQNMTRGPTPVRKELAAQGSDVLFLLIEVQLRILIDDAP
jgi:hypothetical protein